MLATTGCFTSTFTSLYGQCTFFLVVSFIVKGTWFSTWTQLVLKSLFSKSMWENLFPPTVIRVVSTICEQELNPCLRKGCCHNVACWWASARKKIKRKSIKWLLHQKGTKLCLNLSLNISPDADFPFPSNRSSDSQTLGDRQDSLASSLALSCNYNREKKICVMVLRNSESSSQYILDSYISKKVGIPYA